MVSQARRSIHNIGKLEGCIMSRKHRMPRIILAEVSVRGNQNHACGVEGFVQFLCGHFGPCRRIFPSGGIRVVER
jgi:hypothetical protein